MIYSKDRRISSQIGYYQETLDEQFSIIRVAVSFVVEDPNTLPEEWILYHNGQKVIHKTGFSVIRAGAEQTFADGVKRKSPSVIQLDGILVRDKADYAVVKQIKDAERKAKEEQAQAARQKQAVESHAKMLREKQEKDAKELKKREELSKITPNLPITPNAREGDTNFHRNFDNLILD